MDEHRKQQILAMARSAESALDAIYLRLAALREPMTLVVTAVIVVLLVGAGYFLGHP